MALLNSKKSSSNGLGKLYAALELKSSAEGDQFASLEDANSVSNIGGLSDSAFSNFESNFNDMRRTLSELSMESLGADADPMTEAQLDAGAVAALASRNPYAYQKSVFETFSSEDNSVEYNDSPAYSLEAYEANTLQEYAQYSVVLNMAMAKQDEFSELFFKLIVASPDQAGVKATVNYPVVQLPKYHSTKGTAFDVERRRLIESTVDPTILDVASTTIVPWYDDNDADNKAKFIDPAKVAPTTATVNGVSFETSYYRPGVEFDIIGLAQNPANIASGISDHTDTLDRLMALDQLLIGATTTDGESYLPIKVNSLSGAHFQKSPEGQIRQMTLSFVSDQLVIDGQSKDIAGTEAAALAVLRGTPYADWAVRIKAKVNGTANLETGLVDITGSVSIDGARRKVGDRYETVTDKTLMDALKARFSKFAFEGFTLEARMSNANRRLQGLITEVDSYTHRYNVYTSAPIVAKRPQTNVPSTTDFAAPIAVARQLNSIKAINEMLKARDQLAAMDLKSAPLSEITSLDMLGKYLVFPYYNYRELNLVDVLNNLSSKDKKDNVSAAFIDVIRDEAYKAAQFSNYLTALDYMSGGTATKATLAIGTSPRLMRHIIAPGDTRTAGIGFDVATATTPNILIRDTIFLSFVRPQESGFDAMSFGNAIYIPELVTDLPTPRQGAHSREIMVQPRIRHKVNLPILVEIRVSGLDEVINRATPVTLN